MRQDPAGAGRSIRPIEPAAGQRLSLHGFVQDLKSCIRRALPKTAVALIPGSAGKFLVAGVAFRGTTDNTDFRVVRFDTRGHGRSPVPTGPYSVDDLVDDVVALLDRLGAARASVVGLSLGGMTALRLAAREPHRVDRLASR